MKRFLFVTLGLACAMVLSARNSLKYDSTAVGKSFEMRMGAAFTKHFKHNISLGIEEEVRLQLYETTDYYLTDDSKIVYSLTPTPDYFRRSYTTVTLDYKPIPYFGISAGYTLKLLGDKGWSDPNEYIRHRGTIALTGQYKYHNWKFSLRERLDINGRTDSVNTLEKRKVDLRLRHRLQVAYTFNQAPLKVFLNVELINTLNRPLDYLNEVTGDNYKQYLSDVRTQLGLRWRIDKKNALLFSYKFYYGNELDIDITKKAQNLKLWHDISYTHIFCINYELDW